MVIESYNNFYSVIGIEKKDSTYKKNRLLKFKKLSQKFSYTTIRAKTLDCILKLEILLKSAD